MSDSLLTLKQDSWIEVKEWEKFIAQATPNVMLCMPVSTISDPAPYVDWCLDNQVEFVHMHP